MCGIFMTILNKVNSSDLDTLERLFEYLGRRGPDFKQTLVEYDLELYKAHFFSSVLDLRGSNLVEQPIVANGDLLQWNGELYEIKDDDEFSDTLENDGQYVFRKLSDCDSEQGILNLISRLRGEFAFIYWSFKLKTIYFGRDFFGRRSLCWNLNTDLSSLFANDDQDGLDISELDYNLSIASIANYDDQHDWTEVQANGIYKLCLDSKDDKNFNKIKLIKWQSNTDKNSDSLLSPIVNAFNFSLLDSNKIDDEKIMFDYEEKFLRVLRESVRHRVLKQNFKCRNCSSKSNNQSKELNCNHSCLAVLFSGGLDSTVLALLANEFMPSHFPIDLINLAFSQDAADRQTGWSSYLKLKRLAPKRKWNFVKIDITPDQLLDYRERIIKKIIYPLNTVLDDSIGCAIFFAATAKGKLIEDDDLASNLEELSLEKINQLEVKDVNELINRYPSVDYETTSKILLLGQGADEQLSGYSRHRTTFRIGGWLALQNEQNKDINRISFRNLGRDDRMISDNGRESRYPFLDENVVSFLNSLPTNVKCDLNRPKGDGDKRLLRLVGKRIGLTECCKYEKRAIQFGSKIAKLENKKEKAAHISKRLV